MIRVPRLRPASLAEQPNKSPSHPMGQQTSKITGPLLDWWFCRAAGRVCVYWWMDGRRVRVKRPCGYLFRGLCLMPCDGKIRDCWANSVWPLSLRLAVLSAKSLRVWRKIRRWFSHQQGMYITTRMRIIFGMRSCYEDCSDPERLRQACFSFMKATFLFPLIPSRAVYYILHLPHAAVDQRNMTQYNSQLRMSLCRCPTWFFVLMETYCT